MKTVIMLLADGFEEMEAVISIDLLRRADIGVKIVSMKEKTLKISGSRGIVLEADILVQDLMIDYTAENLPDVVFCPGGMLGSANLAKHPCTKEILLLMANKGLIVAMCAAPAVVLAPLGLLDGKTFTCFPGMEVLKEFAPNACPKAYSTDAVVQDGNIITSRAAGTASALAFKLIELLVGKEKAGKIKAIALF